jgi:hypothetical protein
MGRIIVATIVLLMSAGLGANAQGPGRIKISGTKPAEIYPGDRFDIAGKAFGDRQPNNITVMISGTIVDRPLRYKLRVVKWTNERIRLATEETLVPGRWSVGIYRDDETGLISNLASLTVLGGMVIERLEPEAAEPGDTIEIHGRRFGRHQANRVVSMNLNGRKHRMQVLDWSAELIRAQVPNRLARGRYLLLIYYDDSYTISCDSVPITVQ